MEKEFVPYEQALALKELGFDEPCLAQYRKYDVGEATLDIGFSKNELIFKFDNLSLFCSAPLYQQSFRWFREKYLLHGYTNLGFCPRRDAKSGFKGYIVGIHERSFSSSDTFFKEIQTNCFDTPEETELECLKKLIEICKK